MSSDKLKIERCPSCYDLYPIQKMIAVRAGDEFQIVDTSFRGETDPSKRFIYNPVFSVIYLCEECYSRLENKL